jgi:hypothetical protein
LRSHWKTRESFGIDEPIDAIGLMKKTTAITAEMVEELHRLSPLRGSAYGAITRE